MIYTEYLDPNEEKLWLYCLLKTNLGIHLNIHIYLQFPFELDFLPFSTYIYHDFLWQWYPVIQFT